MASVGEGVPADVVAAHLVVEDELPHLWRELVTLPVPLGAGGARVVRLRGANRP